MYAKDLEDRKYQFLIKKRENPGIINLDDPNAFIEYSNTMDDVYNNIDDYNSKRKRKVLIVFHDMIADIMTNKKYQATIKELFIIRKNIFACLFSVHNTIILSRHEQVCLMRLRFERYFSHHRAPSSSRDTPIIGLHPIIIERYFSHHNYISLET